ncbi:MAG: hypothetical protein QM662_14085 [Gordonia sp. (in: high G+C Gram-positive bacteria)]
MIDPDKLADQARGYERVPSFDALPLSGPGRWTVLEPATTLFLYTDDKNILFVKNRAPGVHPQQWWWGNQVSHAHDAGESATEAFDRLSVGREVVVGDLSELAIEIA